MKKQFVVPFLLLASGCNPSSVVSSVDDAIEKDAILDSFEPEPDKKDFKAQTIKTVDEHIEKPDELLFTVEPEDKERQNSTVPLGDDAIEHHPLLQD